MLPVNPLVRRLVGGLARRLVVPVSHLVDRLALASSPVCHSCAKAMFRTAMVHDLVGAGLRASLGGLTPLLSVRLRPRACSSWQRILGTTVSASS